MAKIIIVDENDEVIGSKERSEVTPSDIERVTGLWVTNSKNEVLLCKRKMTKKFGAGHWQPAVAGTVEEGETYESNIYKEAEEELGITGVKFEKWEKHRTSSDHEYFSQSFRVKLDWPIERFNPTKEEFDEIRWFDLDELAADLKIHPEKYTSSLPKRIGQLIEERNAGNN